MSLFCNDTGIYIKAFFRKWRKYNNIGDSGNDPENKNHFLRKQNMSWNLFEKIINEVRPQKTTTETDKVCTGVCEKSQPVNQSEECEQPAEEPGHDDTASPDQCQQQ